MMFRRFLSFAFAALCAATARADETPRLLLASDLPAEVTQRLHAELTSAGFEVVDVAAEEARPLEEVAASERAALALSIRRNDEGYELWLRDRVTDKTVVREVLRRDEALALRAVELIRASLLELRTRHEVEGEMPATPELSAIAEEALVRPEAPEPPPTPWVHVTPPPRQLSMLEQIGEGFVSTDLTAHATLEAGVLGLHDGGGLGSSYGFEIGGGWFGSRTTQARLVGRYYATSLTLDEGTIDVRVMQFGTSAVFFFIEPTAAFSPFVEAGHLITFVQVEGSSDKPGIDGGYDVPFAVVPFIAPGFSAGVPGFPLRIRGSFGIGVSVPEIELVVRGSEVASWARPLVFGGLSAQYLFE